MPHAKFPLHLAGVRQWLSESLVNLNDQVINISNLARKFPGMLYWSCEAAVRAIQMGLNACINKKTLFETWSLVGHVVME